MESRLTAHRVICVSVIIALTTLISMPAAAQRPSPEERPLIAGDPLRSPAVNPAGDDGLDGPEGDPTGPFATLPVVSDELRQMVAQVPAEEPLRVIVQLRHLPHDRVSRDVQARHADERTAIDAKVTSVLAELAARRDPTLPADADNLPALMETFPQEREALRTVNERHEALSLRVLDEMKAELEAELEPFVGRVRAEIGRLGGEVEFSTIAGSLVVARVPASRIDELGRHPDVLRVVEDRVSHIQLDIMDDATLVNAAGGPWSSGFDGGIYDPAIIDTGLDLGHPAMINSTSPQRGNFYTWYLVAGSADPEYDDVPTEDDLQGHGTHVAGIVASYGSTGYTSHLGMANGVDKLVTLKAGWRTTSGDGAMYWSDRHNIADRALYHPDQLRPFNTFNDDVDGLNLSFSGGTTSDDTGDSRFWDSVISSYPDLPMTVSAGNTGPSNTLFNNPALTYNAITVANVQDHNTVDRHDDTIASTSSVGPTASGRRKPDIAAPGTGIVAPNNNWETSSDFISKSGTSMAAPSVLGILMDLMDAGVTDELELKALLINTAQKNEPGIDFESDDDGWHPQIGWGYMNAQSAYYHRADVVTSSVTPRGTTGEYRLFKGTMRDEGSIGEGRDRVTMVWNRHATYNPAAPPTTYFALSDLNLRLYRESDELRYDTDLTVLDNVHQVRISSGSGMTDVIVKAYSWSTSFAHGGPTESFALATEEGFTEVDLPASFSAGGMWQSSVEPGEVIDVSVRITNDSEIASHDNTFDLNLPTGWVRLSGNEVQNVGSVAGGGGTSDWAHWTVQAPPAPPTGATQIHTPHSHHSYNTPFTGANWYLPVTVEWDTDPPTPNPMVFSTSPALAGTTVISMVATVATDLHEPVEYYLLFAGSPTGGPGGTPSGWQASRSYTDGGLEPNNEYCYRPYARDSSAAQNQTSLPSSECAFTMIQTPLAPTLSAISTSSINAQSQGTFNNLSAGWSGLCVHNLHNLNTSGWVHGPVNWTNTGLATNHEYGYATRARNGDGLEAPVGPSASAYTLIEAPMAPAVTGTSATTVDLQSQGSYSNLDAGSSGLRVANLTQGTSSGWVQGPVSWTSAGLSPNTEYAFAGMSRNGDGVENPASLPTSVVTRAAEPASGPVFTLTHESVTARWSANGNPPGTEYVAENTTTLASSGWTTDVEWFDTSTGPSATYAYRVKARNAAGVETAFVDLGTVATPFWGDGFESGSTSAWSGSVP